MTTEGPRDEPDAAAGRTSPPSPPQRPAVATDAPPIPAVGVDAVPTPVSTAFWLWIGSFVAGLAAAAYALTRLDELTAALAATIAEQQLDFTSEQLDTVVPAVVYATVGGIVVLVLVLLGLAVLMRARRGWSRALLVVVGLLGIPVLAIAQDVITGRPRLLVLLQAVLMVMAAVMSYLPESNAWFRNRG